MKKSLLLLVSCFVLSISSIQAQDIIIGKENSGFPDFFPPGNKYNYLYNQFIYKQSWIHAQGAINKISYYYNGNSSLSYGIKIYMGHTSRKAFAGNDWIPAQDLTLVYDGLFTLPGATGWLDLTLQTPFVYNNVDNLVIVFDKNSVDPPSDNGWFSNSILDDDAASVMARDESYNIEPDKPLGTVGVYREIPNLKISGTLTESPYLYFYGSRNRDISTDPNSSIILDVETNLNDYNIDNNQSWISTAKDLGASTLTAKVVSLNSTLVESKRTSRLIISGTGAKNDTIFVNQNMCEPKTINYSAYYFTDYNNDNKLELIGSYPEVGVNTGNGNFNLQNLTIPDLSSGITFWGDYDNDGDLDFLMIGYETSSNRITKIFRNDGNDVFTDIKTDLKVFWEMESGYWSNAQWFDYNNDGKRDLLISGFCVDNSANTILYRNLGNDQFVNSGLVFPKIKRGSTDFGDYNNDGLTDLVIIGEDINGNCISTIYKNMGSGQFVNIESNLLGLKMGNVKWGDFDNDGDLDLLITGLTNLDVRNIRIYRNDGNDVFTDINSGLKIAPVSWANWADIDDNGTMDIIAYSSGIGKGGTMERYYNTGPGKFIRQDSLTIPDYWQAARFSTGDYDNDGDIDYVLHHNYKTYSQVFRNNSNKQNDPPSIPSGLKTFRNGTRIYLQWNRSVDSETSSKSLSYNIRVGTAPGKGDIVFPHADPVNGFVKVPEMGNCNLDTLFMLDNLPLGTYYWSVQSIDNVYKGSAFSQEQSFSVLPPFSKLDPGIAKLNSSSAAWGDYDNDNDMDLVITGRLTNFDGETTRIYKNTGDSTFTEIILNISGRYEGSVAWGDYDNDNDIDVLISGKNSAGQDRAKIIRNDGNDQFSELPVTFSSTQYSSAIWGDTDNDGDLDIAVNRSLYRNNGNGTFTSRPLTSLYADMTNNSFADYDNDGDLDFFLSAQWIPQTLFKNNNGAFTSSTINNNQLYWGSMDWADYDRDGDPDLLSSGYNSEHNSFSIISRNDGSGKFTNIQTGLRGVSMGQARWGDFDNDGDPDIVLGGFSGTKILKVYGNKGNNTFEEIFDHPFDVNSNNEQVNQVAWGDYNNDGNLDFIKNGLIFSNNYNTPNIPPKVPVNLKSILKGFDAYFTWEDYLNPAGVTYNMRIGTTPGGTQVMSPMSNLQSGYRKIPVIGNVQSNSSWIIKNLKPGITYYWSVQAIDPAFKGGVWATEKSFTVRNVYPEFVADTVCLGLSTKIKDLTVSPSEGIASWKWDFGDGNISTLQNPSHQYMSSGNFIVKLTVLTASFADSVYKTIVVKPKPSADFTADVSCLGNETPVINTTNLNDLLPVKWEWDFGDKQKSALKDPGSHGYILSGDYPVKLMVTASNGCSDSIQKHVIVVSYPVAVITANAPLTFCAGDSVILSVGTNSNYSYNWLLSNTSITNSNKGSYTAMQSGTYSVEVINMAGNCKSTSAPVSVVRLEKPSLPVLVTENYTALTCPGESPFVLKVDQPVNEYTYNWKRNGSPYSNVIISKLEGMLPAGDYTVIASKAGCQTESKVKSIVFDVSPDKPYIYVKGPSVWFLACSNTNATRYKWYFNGTIIPGAEENFYLANQKLGSYNVSVSNEKGCFTMSDTIKIPKGTTGIDDVDPFEDVKIYPNPSPGLFTIEMNNQIYGDLFISIFDHAGREILNIKFEKTNEHFSSQIDLSGQGRGIYYISLQIRKQISNKKIIIE